MTSFISNFKAIIIAILIIISIEFTYWCIFKPEPLLISNFFELAYLKKENNTKLGLLGKMRAAAALHADYLQVGDSSGLHGLNPKVIEKYLDGKTYTNSSMGADFGYFGHYNVAHAIVANTDFVKTLVLYVTPFARPAYAHDLKRVLEKSVYSSFISPWHILNPPTLASRTIITNLIYYGKNSEMTYGKATLFGSNNMKEAFMTSKGFIPREVSFPKEQLRPINGCRFADWFEISAEGKRPIDFFYTGLEKMAKLARQKKISLVVVFNPVTCHQTEELGTLNILRELALFRENYPEVIFPFPFITTWPKERFTDSWHLYSAAATIMSERLGKELHKAQLDPSYRGVSATSVVEIDKRIQQAQQHILRPIQCEDKPGLNLNYSKQNVYKNCLGMSFINLPSGQFMMGSCRKQKNCPAGVLPDKHADKSEFPVHLVNIKPNIQMAKTPVTVAQFKTFLKYYDGTDADPHATRLAIDPLFVANNQFKNKPVTMVTWNDAQAFVNWLNKIKPKSDHSIYRLATEAEREYAARAGTKTRFWWGEEPDLTKENISKTNDVAKKVAAVASHVANPFGLYDMNGNVLEWTQDCYRPWYNSHHNDGKAYERIGCNKRVIRGSAATLAANAARTAARRFQVENSRHKYLGFRVVREIV